MDDTFDSNIDHDDELRIDIITNDKLSINDTSIGIMTDNVDTYNVILLTYHELCAITIDTLAKYKNFQLE